MDIEIEIEDSPTQQYCQLSVEAKRKALKQLRRYYTPIETWSEKAVYGFCFNAGLMGVNITHISYEGEDNTDEGAAFYGEFTTDNDISMEDFENYMLYGDEKVEKLKRWLTEIKELSGDVVISGLIKESGTTPHNKQNMAFDYSRELDEVELSKAVKLMSVYHEMADMLHEELIMAKRKAKSDADLVRDLESGKLRATFYDDGEIFHLSGY